MTRAEEEIIERIAAQLAEHWEGVQILVSRAEPDGTGRYFYGVGNWYTRQGMAHDFIKSEEARTAASEIGKAINPDD